MAAQTVNNNVGSDQEHPSYEDRVLIAGGGPIGMVTATVLAHYGVKSIVLERNMSTTKWPKMDLTNARSMELFRKLGIADSLREQGVPSHIPYNVIFSTGLNHDAPVTKWDHISVDDYKKLIVSQNDGTQPQEPYQRVSQSIFESWMKELCDKNPLIDLRFGWKIESVKENPEGVDTQVLDLNTNEAHIFKSKYVVGCDGASSKTRRSLAIPLDGGPVPAVFLLVHFKSHDLARIHKQGGFWHLFILEDEKFGGAVISQDEKNTFTVHFPLPPGVDESTISSEEAVYTVLGGQEGPYEVAIDEVLVRSTYQPSIAVARQFAGPELRVFLAGDSAHQNIPTGGYGMNTGLGDAFDIGWKLAAVINGHGRRGLLKSYEEERKKISLTNVERSGVHMATHMAAVGILGKGGVSEITQRSEKGAKLRDTIHKHYLENNGENTDLGVEMGYRYSSLVCIPDEETPAPTWNPHVYVPTTTPGSRPPHVLLNDGSSIFDHLGRDYTLVEFGNSTPAERGSVFLVEAAKILGVPLTHVKFVDEDNAATLWELPLVLVRPDQHVSWRGHHVENVSKTTSIMNTVVGYEDESTTKSKVEAANCSQDIPRTFTSTQGMTTQTTEYVLENMGEFQK